MSESKNHSDTKSKAAGVKGQTEVPLSRGRRLDSLTASGHRATEVERSGNESLLQKAARRLNDSGAPQKVLQVPQKDMPAAAKAMREVGTSGTVKNLGGTKTMNIRSPKK